MFCTLTMLRLSNFIISSIQVTEDRMLTSPVQDNRVCLHVVVLNEGAHKFSKNL